MPGADELGYTRDVKGVWMQDGVPLSQEELDVLGITSAVEDFEWEYLGEDPDQPQITRVMVGGEWIDSALEGANVLAQPHAQPQGQTRAAPASVASMGRAGGIPGGIPGLLTALQDAQTRQGKQPTFGSSPSKEESYGTKEYRRIRDNYEAIYGPGTFEAELRRNATLRAAATKALLSVEPPPKPGALPDTVQDQKTGIIFQRTANGEFESLGRAPKQERPTPEQAAFALFERGGPGDLERAQQIMDFANQATPEQRLRLGMQLATSPADAFVFNAIRRGDLPLGTSPGVSPYLGGQRGGAQGGLLGAITGVQQRPQQALAPGVLGGDEGLARERTPRGGLEGQLGAGGGIAGISPTMTPEQAGAAFNTYGLEAVQREKLRQLGGELPPTQFPEEYGGGIPQQPIGQVFGSQSLEELMNTYGLAAVQKEQLRQRGGRLPDVYTPELEGLGSAMLPSQKEVPPEILELRRQLSGEPLGPSLSSAAAVQAQGFPLLMRSAQTRGNLSPAEEGIFRGYLGALGGLGVLGVSPDEYLEEERRATTPGRVFGQTEPGLRIRQRPRRIG